MNTKKLLLSIVVIINLIGVPTRTNPMQTKNSRKIAFALLSVVALISYRLAVKKPVTNPIENYTWHDIPTNLLNREFKKAWEAFDEQFIGQRAKKPDFDVVIRKNLQIRFDELIMKNLLVRKEHVVTPATGICGKSQEVIYYPLNLIEKLLQSILKEYPELRVTLLLKLLKKF